MILAAVVDPLYLEHQTGKRHPEKPERAAAIGRAIASLSLPIIQPKDASEEDLLLCHTTDYLLTIKQNVQQMKQQGLHDGSYCLSTDPCGDTRIGLKSYEVALRAVGGVLSAVDAVMRGDAARVFCAVRPPGHHAHSHKGHGFCLFNNIAIAARYAQTTYKISRILVADWDVHHGDGTQQIFFNDPSVYYFSTHEEGNFPYSGAKDERGRENTTLNVPIEAGSNSRAHVLEAFENTLASEMERFKPELILISCGFDGHKDDPIGGFSLTSQDFGRLTRSVVHLANHYCQGKLISVLEGGYNIKALEEAAIEHLRALRESPMENP